LINYMIKIKTNKKTNKCTAELFTKDQKQALTKKDFKTLGPLNYCGKKR